MPKRVLEKTASEHCTGPRKRHIAWSNSRAICKLDRGRLTRHQREACLVKPTDKKVVNGKVVYTGNKFLKSTQRSPERCLFHAFALSSSCPVLLRSYPIPFGLRVLRLFGSFTKAVPRDVFPKMLEEIDVPLVFGSAKWGDWSEADLMSCCLYLRGSTHLKISPRWRAVFPDRPAESLLR